GQFQMFWRISSHTHRRPVTRPVTSNQSRDATYAANESSPATVAPRQNNGEAWSARRAYASGVRRICDPFDAPRRTRWRKMDSIRVAFEGNGKTDRDRRRRPGSTSELS